MFYRGTAFCPFVCRVHLKTVVVAQSFTPSVPPDFFFLTHSILGREGGESLTVFSPLILFPLQVAHFWIFWPFSHLWVRALLYPRAAVTSLGLRRLAEETNQRCPGGETTATCRTVPSCMHFPEPSSSPEDSTAFPVFLSSPAKKTSNSSLTPWLLQLSPQNRDVI